MWIRTASWPAYACAIGLLVYATEKTYYAATGRLGVPGGARVPAEAYAELGHVALRQGTLAAAGVAGALLALATVAKRRPPRPLLLCLLWGAMIPLAAGAPFVVRMVITDGPSRLGGALVSLVMAGLWLAMTRSYQLRTGRPS
jgi:hypothetical protein